MIPNAQKQKDMIISTINGELIPFEVDPSKPFYLSISPTINATFSFDELKNGISLSDAFPDLSGTYGIAADDFKIEFINGKISVSAIIRDSNGIKIAQIANNTWKMVNPDTLLYWDRNFNAYAFEIINSNNVPTFQVFMTGQNEIQIGGFFYTSPPEGIYIYSLDGIKILTTEIYSDLSYSTGYLEKQGAGFLFLGNRGISGIESLVGDRRIFKYPALNNPENLGKLASSEIPSDNPLAKSDQTLFQGLLMQIFGTIFVFIAGVGIPTFVIESKSKGIKDKRTYKQQNISHGIPYWKLKRIRRNNKKTKRKHGKNN